MTATTVAMPVGEVKHASPSRAGMVSSYRMLLSAFFAMMFLNYIRFDPQMITTKLAEAKSTQKLNLNYTEEQDTAIIITSSWIPSHPSTFLIDSVLNSTRRHLLGLAPSAPIFITVDSMPTSTTSSSHLEEKIETLEQYIINLYQKHLVHPHVHILPSVQHLHIGGSVMKALQLIEIHYPHVQYVYSLQHDFPFSRDVDHIALRNVMERYSERVNWIRFPKRDPNTLHPGCGNEESIWYNKTFTMMNMESTILAINNTKKNGTSTTVPFHWESMQLQLIPTTSYSDNNHLARLAWYKDMLASLVMLTRPPEFPLQVRANEACQKNQSIGLYVYHEVCLEHLDGRNNAKVGSR